MPIQYSQIYQAVLRSYQSIGPSKQQVLLPDTAYTMHYPSITERRLMIKSRGPSPPLTHHPASEPSKSHTPIFSPYTYDGRGSEPYLSRLKKDEILP